MIWFSVALVVMFLALVVFTCRRSPPAVTVEVDDMEIRHTIGEKIESVRWDELVRVEIVTTDQGPFVDDLLWLFFGRDGKGCALAGADVDERVFSRLNQLPGVDSIAIIKAMGSTDNASFLVWSADSCQRLPPEPAPTAQN